MIDQCKQFLTDCYSIFDTRSIVVLDSFIAKYKESEVASFSQYARGLADDYDAVKNSLIFKEISNGPVEALNNSAKALHRRCRGRASVELLTAYSVVEPKPYRKVS